MTPHYYNTYWGSYDYHFYILHLNKHFLPTATSTHYYCYSTTYCYCAKGSYSPETKALWTKSNLMPPPMVSCGLHRARKDRPNLQASTV